MKQFFSNLAKKMRQVPDYESESSREEEYLELDTQVEEKKHKVIVRRFILEEFEGIKEILDVFREGQTIAFINIRPLREKDLVELKRSINKLKKTTEAMSGEITGFGEDWLVMVPSFAKIYRSKQNKPVEHMAAQS